MSEPGKALLNVGSRKKTRTLSARLILIFTVVLVVSTISIGVIGYYMNRQSAIHENSRRALDISRTVALTIDADRFLATVESGEMDEYYTEVKAYLDEVFSANELHYLYVLHSIDDTDVYYFAEGTDPGDDADLLVLNDTEAVSYYDERVYEVFKGVHVAGDQLYDAEEWGVLTSGMAPILGDDGNVIGIVGADVVISDIMEEVDRLGFMTLLITIVISAVVGIAMAYYLRRSLGHPTAELTRVAKQIALGEPDVSIDVNSNTEIGELADSFRDMVASIDSQAQTLMRISEGDLSVDIVPRSENDVMGHALIDTTTRLSDMINQINELCGEVASESVQMAGSARALATGATSQASAVEELSASITEISIQTKQNTDLAEKSASLANSIRDSATGSFNQVEALIAAVGAINTASNAIRSVVKAIEDIAFQTNLLAFNASVEAARAGDMGKGFGVVSREVQNLSRKTSESAKETADLISDAIAKAKQGVELAEQVHASMSRVIEGVVESDRVANEIAQSSKEQMIAIDQINKSITLVAGVVHQNSNVAEQSAATSQEMSEQAASLSSLVSLFQTRKQSANQ